MLRNGPDGMEHLRLFALIQHGVSPQDIDKHASLVIFGPKQLRRERRQTPDEFLPSHMSNGLSGNYRGKFPGKFKKEKLALIICACAAADGALAGGADPYDGVSFIDAQRLAQLERRRRWRRDRRELWTGRGIVCRRNYRTRPCRLDRQRRGRECRRRHIG